MKYFLLLFLFTCAAFAQPAPRPITVVGTTGQIQSSTTGATNTLGLVRDFGTTRSTTDLPSVILTGTGNTAKTRILHLETNDSGQTNWTGSWWSINDDVSLSGSPGSTTESKDNAGLPKCMLALENNYFNSGDSSYNNEFWYGSQDYRYMFFSHHANDITTSGRWQFACPMLIGWSSPQVFIGPELTLEAAHTSGNRTGLSMFNDDATSHATQISLNGDFFLFNDKSFNGTKDFAIYGGSSPGYCIYVDSSKQVGINKSASLAATLDVTGTAAISGNLTAGSFGTVDATDPGGNHAIQGTSNNLAGVLRRTGMSNSSGGQTIIDIQGSASGTPTTYVDLLTMGGDFTAGSRSSTFITSASGCPLNLTANSKSFSFGGGFGFTTPGLYSSANSTFDANLTCATGIGKGYSFQAEGTTELYLLSNGNAAIRVAGTKIIDFKSTGVDVTGQLTASTNAVIGATSGNANAILDVQSTTKAFMPPRMTTTQKNAIASPTAGMVVYDSTLTKLSAYNGSVWEIETDGSGLFTHFTDTTSTHTDGTEDDLYSDSITAGTFGANGESITEVEHVQFVSSATAARRVRKYFGGTLIFDTGTLTPGLGGVDITITSTAIQESSTVARCDVSAVGTTIAVLPPSTYTRITGLTMTGALTLKTTGTASGTGAASGDILDKISVIKTP